MAATVPTPALASAPSVSFPLSASSLARWTKFAARGGIGLCVARTDREAGHANDLMFMEGEEITMLVAGPGKDEYLGCCEGVVGKFSAKDVTFPTTTLKRPVLLARSASVSSLACAPTSPSAQCTAPAKIVNASPLLPARVAVFADGQQALPEQLSHDHVWPDGRARQSSTLHTSSSASAHGLENVLTILTTPESTTDLPNTPRARTNSTTSSESTPQLASASPSPSTPDTLDETHAPSPPLRAVSKFSDASSAYTIRSSQHAALSQSKSSVFSAATTRSFRTSSEEVLLSKFSSNTSIFDYMSSQRSAKSSDLSFAAEIDCERRRRYLPGVGFLSEEKLEVDEEGEETVSQEQLHSSTLTPGEETELFGLIFDSYRYSSSDASTHDLAPSSLQGSPARTRQPVKLSGAIDEADSDSIDVMGLAYKSIGVDKFEQGDEQDVFHPSLPDTPSSPASAFLPSSPTSHSIYDDLSAPQYLSSWHPKLTTGASPQYTLPASLSNPSPLEATPTSFSESRSIHRSESPGNLSTHEASLHIDVKCVTSPKASLELGPATNRRKPSTDLVRYGVPVQSKDFEEERVKAGRTSFDIVKPLAVIFSVKPSSSTILTAHSSSEEGWHRRDDSDAAAIGLHVHLPIADVARPTEGRDADSYRTREAAWIKVIGGGGTKTRKHKGIGQAGIPSSLRGRAWCWLAESGNDQTPGLYHTLCSTDKIPLDDEVDRDLLKTYLDETQFGFDRPGRDDLGGVLKALVRAEPSLGHVEGIGHVASVLLDHLPAEEAFWLLIHLVRNYGFAKFGRVNKVKMDVDMLAFAILLESLNSTLAVHLKLYDVMPQSYLLHWRATLFATALPAKTRLRIIDLVFYDPRFINQTALAILDVSCATLLELRSRHAILAFLSTLPSSDLNFATLLSTLFTTKVSDNKVKKATKRADAIIRQAIKNRK